MNHLIERYIYDVTRRLSENDREEVNRELEAGIMDMLPDQADEQQIIDVLTKLGEPRLMAEKYRAKPRYLISPAMFDMYISVLKLVVPIVAAVLAGVAALAAIFDPASFTIGKFIGAILENAVSGALQAAFWITLGFAIADHVNINAETWTVNDLPKKPEVKKTSLSKTSSIVEIIVTVFFTLIIILMIIRDEWFFVFVRNSEVINPFTMEALYRIIPYMLITAMISVMVSAFKIYYGHWNVPLLMMNTVYNIIWVGIAFYVLSWQDLFNPDMIKAVTPYIEDSMNDFAISLIQLDGSNLRIFFGAILVLIALISTIDAAYQTYKDQTAKNRSR
ncbi:MAG: hypothetical protein FWC09_04675 [Lachnospiraceae bacterium]|nr:hypothetical protein [Lachnospiraceae bacterium]